MTNGNLSRAEEISDVLREEILTGQYRPGERLPSERDLAGRFAANRGAVREALKKLEQLGIADIQPGGVRVVPVKEATLEVLSHILRVKDIPDPVLVDQMFEVSSALISLSIRTAVEKATPEQIDYLRNLLKKILSASSTPLEKKEYGLKFREYLFEVHGNLVLQLIGNGLRTQFMGHTESIDDLVELNDQQSMKLLKKLDSAIARRDADGAANAALEHLSLLRVEVRTLLQSMSHDSDRIREMSNA
jgi:DNA-binding FadR family transcriptional regulator